MDDDVGYGLLRVTRDQRWSPFYIGNPVYNLVLQLFFEYGVAAQHLELGKVAKGRVPREEFVEKRKIFLKKIFRQVAKDYVVYPALTGPAWKSTLSANFMANIIRNIWTNAVIFCGHFPDGAEKFTKKDMENETQGQWYLRQMLGSANIDAGPVMAFMTGNLSYQIEHHLFPDLPSNRLAEISVRVEELAEKYDLPYTSGPLAVQYVKSWRTIAKLAVPNKYLKATSDDAPETASERKFNGEVYSTFDPVTGERHGLQTALTAGRKGVFAKLSERGRARRRAKRMRHFVPMQSRRHDRGARAQRLSTHASARRKHREGHGHIGRAPLVSAQAATRASCRAAGAVRLPARPASTKPTATQPKSTSARLQRGRAVEVTDRAKQRGQRPGWKPLPQRAPARGQQFRGARGARERVAHHHEQQRAQTQARPAEQRVRADDERAAREQAQREHAGDREVAARQHTQPGVQHERRGESGQRGAGCRRCEALAGGGEGERGGDATEQCAEHDRQRAGCESGASRIVGRQCDDRARVGRRGAGQCRGHVVEHLRDRGAGSRGVEDGRRIAGQYRAVGFAVADALRRVLGVGVAGEREPFRIELCSTAATNGSDPTTPTGRSRGARLTAGHANATTNTATAAATATPTAATRGGGAFAGIGECRTGS